MALCCKVIEVLYCCCLLTEKMKPIMLSFCFCFPISGPISVGHYPSIYVALQDIKSVESKVLAGICQNEKVADWRIYDRRGGWFSRTLSWKTTLQFKGCRKVAKLEQYQLRESFPTSHLLKLNIRNGMTQDGQPLVL